MYTYSLFKKNKKKYVSPYYFVFYIQYELI